MTTALLWLLGTLALAVFLGLIAGFIVWVWQSYFDGIVARCLAAQVTINSPSDARSYIVRTGRTLTLCPHCRRHHAWDK